MAVNTSDKMNFKIIRDMSRVYLFAYLLFTFIFLLLKPYLFSCRVT